MTTKTQAEPKIINYGILLPKSAASKVPSDYEDKLEEYSSEEIHDICMSRVKLSLIRNSK